MIKKHNTWGAGILAASLLCAIPLRADFVLSAPSIIAYPGTSGTFEVTLTNTGPSTVNLSGFSFEINASSTDVTLTDATIATVAHTYIFAGNSGFGPDIDLDPPGQMLDALDYANTPASFTAVAANASFGLGLISFDVSPSATTPENVIVSFNAANSSLTDDMGTSLTNFTVQSGTIGVVPEPSGALLAAAGLAILSAALIRRSRAA